MRNRSSMAALYRRRAFSLLARRFLPLRLRRLRLYVRLDLLLPLAILPGELVGHQPPAILFDEPPVPLLAGQPWIHLEHLHGLARDPAGAVDLLLGAPLDEHVAALALLVRRQVCSHLRGERVEVGKRPLLRERRGGEHQRNHQRAHDSIITPPSRSSLLRSVCHPYAPISPDAPRGLLPVDGRSGQSAPPAPPKLILVVSVDQMRFDFLDRFAPLYRSGLKTLLERGAVFSNAKYRHAATETGPGHSILLTGSDPSTLASSRTTGGTRISSASSTSSTILCRRRSAGPAGPLRRRTC